MHRNKIWCASVQASPLSNGGSEGVMDLTAGAASAGPAPQQGKQQGTSWLDKVGSCRAQRLCVLLQPLHGLLTQQDEAGEALKPSHAHNWTFHHAV